MTAADNPLKKRVTITPFRKQKRFWMKRPLTTQLIDSLRVLLGKHPTGE